LAQNDHSLESLINVNPEVIFEFCYLNSSPGSDTGSESLFGDSVEDNFEFSRLEDLDVIKNYIYIFGVPLTSVAPSIPSLDFSLIGYGTSEASDESLTNSSEDAGSGSSHGGSFSSIDLDIDVLEDSDPELYLEKARESGPAARRDSTEDIKANFYKD